MDEPLIRRRVKRCRSRSWMLAAATAAALVVGAAGTARAADPTMDASGGSDMQGASGMGSMGDMGGASGMSPAAAAQSDMSSPAAPQAATTQPTTAPAKAKSPAAETDDIPAVRRFRQRLGQAIAGLNLTADQRVGIRAVLEQAYTDGQALREQLADASPSERAQRMRQFVRNLLDKVEAQLTADQLQEFKAVMAGGNPTSRPAGVAESEPLPRSDRPAGGSAAGPGGGPAAENPFARLPRLRQALAELDLNEDQKAKVDAVLNDATKKALAIPVGAADRFAQMQQIRQSVREQVLEILEPDQAVALREKLAAINGNGLAPRRTGAGGAATHPAVNAAAAAGASGRGGAAADAESSSAGSAIAGGPIAVGRPAPPFKLETLDGYTINTASLKGHVTALVFGSYSSPIFRDRAASLEKLWRRLDDADSTVKMFVVYTKEAHPAGGWQVDRNKQDRINIPLASTDEQRRGAARACKDALHLTIPFLVDTMDDATATAYGGFPDAAVVIGPDGTIVATQRWAEAAALQRQIDAASATGQSARIAP